MIVARVLTGPEVRPAVVAVEESMPGFDEGVQVVDAADGPLRVDAPPGRNSS